jgi:hypothetical protein
LGFRAGEREIRAFELRCHGDEVRGQAAMLQGESDVGADWGEAVGA